MKKITMWFLLVGFVFGLVLVGCSSQTQEEKAGENGKGTIESIKERGRLIIGVKTDFPPFGYVDEKGDITGFEVALAKRFAKELFGDESKVELVPVTGPNRVPYLQSDKVDIILATMSVTEDREKVVDFTNPHFKTSSAVIVRADSDIQAIKDLAGKKVIVVKGSTGDINMTKLVPDAELLKLGNNTEALQALKDGRGDAYMQDNVMLYYWARNNGGFRILDEQVDPTPWAPAVKEGNTELKEWINQTLEKLGEEQYMHKLYDEYLKDQLGSDLNPDDFVVEGGKL
ncbi:transporter substrate-binding domain-containing protein [Microaerobacter geothermalis]|uniref:transporter substrate-binding domain-containing protein n=1 Tax=Microaerobacter geothermalis TaxID=674972 RepID=UPI001F3578E3|nr:transporter substrate-binding domain-containing protein [Microaerobacter geothermalis]MCF6093866.1 transporter substrate-binding domain-containing protein [Microaerobacter geothermalis]